MIHAQKYDLTKRGLKCDDKNTPHPHCVLLYMNFFIMNGNSQKGILCVHYYLQHSIKMLFVSSYLLFLTKTLANESNKTSVKIQQRNNHSWVESKTSCPVLQPVTTEGTQHAPQNL